MLFLFSKLELLVWFILMRHVVAVHVPLERLPGSGKFAQVCSMSPNAILMHIQIMYSNIIFKDRYTSIMVYF